MRMGTLTVVFLVASYPTFCCGVTDFRQELRCRTSAWKEVASEISRERVAAIRPGALPLQSSAIPLKVRSIFLLMSLNTPNLRRLHQRSGWHPPRLKSQQPHGRLPLCRRRSCSSNILGRHANGSTAGWTSATTARTSINTKTPDNTRSKAIDPLDLP